MLYQVDSDYDVDDDIIKLKKKIDKLRERNESLLAKLQISETIKVEKTSTISDNCNSSCLQS
jgi:hypothetical protein